MPVRAQVWEWELRAGKPGSDIDVKDSYAAINFSFIKYNTP